MPRTGSKARSAETRPVLYQLCRAGERFEVGDGPVDLSRAEELVLGRGDPTRSSYSKGRVHVDDPWMSSNHARLFFEGKPRRKGGHVFIEDMGSTNGVLVNGELVGRAPLEHGDLVETGRTFWIYLEEPADLPLPTEPVEFGTWATWTPALAQALEKLEAEVTSDTHLLLSGPEGTGKGFLARTVHLMSGRPGRLIHLDCRERKPKRLLVDLFGGDGQPARIREADLGTLFLEHVDALPLDIQDRLIDVLRNKSFLPGGRSRSVFVDIRVVASTTLEVEEAIAMGRLRALFVQLVGGLSIRLPGLDERRADLGLLLDDFLARARGAQAITREACRAVLLHPWRLHIKAFARVIESAAVLAAGLDEEGRRTGAIDLMHLPVEVVGADALAALLPDEAPQKRPPSFRAAPLDDPEATDGVGIPPIDPTKTPSDGFLNAVADVQHLVDDYDALDRTDPTVRHHGANRVVLPKWESSSSGERTPGGQASAGQSSPSGERPPSAYHDLAGLERSYASAIDPDLIVEALKKSRGNVSAAARFLGKPRALVLRWMREFQIRAERYR